MFHKDEWTKVIVQVNNTPRIAYRNEHTGLMKLKETFTREQQKQLEPTTLSKYPKWC